MDLPKVESLTAELDKPDELQQIIIPGILKRGRKMLIAGSSKSGKSLLLMELCATISSGGMWLGIEIPKNNVLYVNFEIAEDSVTMRFRDICRSLGLAKDALENVYIWNLRGYARPLDKLLTSLIPEVNRIAADVVILDPIYKILTGDENSASDMGYFANQIDRICDSTGAAVIYCHHHSKGLQTGKKAIDRASGSGVFARDPDAVIDITETKVKDRSLWKMQAVLREFAERDPIYFDFVYPLHNVVNIKKIAEKKEDPALNSALTALYKESDSVTVKSLADKLDITLPTARARLKKAGYHSRRGIVLSQEE